MAIKTREELASKLAKDTQFQTLSPERQKALFDNASNQLGFQKAVSPAAQEVQPETQERLLKSSGEARDISEKLISRRPSAIQELRRDADVIRTQDETEGTAPAAEAGLTGMATSMFGPAVGAVAGQALTEKVGPGIEAAAKSPLTTAIAGLEATEGVLADVGLNLQSGNIRDLPSEIAATLKGERPAEIGDILQGAGVHPVAASIIGLTAVGGPGLLKTAASGTSLLLKAGGNLTVKGIKEIAKLATKDLRKAITLPKKPALATKQALTTTDIETHLARTVAPLEKRIELAPGQIATKIDELVPQIKSGLAKRFTRMQKAYGANLDRIFKSVKEPVPAEPFVQSVGSILRSRELIDDTGKIVKNNLDKATTVEKEIAGFYSRLTETISRPELFGPTGELVSGGVKQVAREFTPKEINEGVKSLRKLYSTGFKKGAKSMTPDDKLVSDTIYNIAQGMEEFGGEALAALNKSYASIRQPLDKSNEVFKFFSKTDAIDRGGRNLRSLSKKTKVEMDFMRQVEGLSDVKFVDDVVGSQQAIDIAGTQVKLARKEAAEQIKLRRSTAAGEGKRIDAINAQITEEFAEKTAEVNRLRNAGPFGITPNRLGAARDLGGILAKETVKPFLRPEISSTGMREGLGLMGALSPSKPKKKPQQVF